MSLSWIAELWNTRSDMRMKQCTWDTYQFKRYFVRLFIWESLTIGKEIFNRTNVHCDALVSLLQCLLVEFQRESCFYPCIQSWWHNKGQYHSSGTFQHSILHPHYAYWNLQGNKEVGYCKHVHWHTTHTWQNANISYLHCVFLKCFFFLFETWLSLLLI